MTTESLKVIEAVEELNQLLYNQHKEEELVFTYSTNGFIDVVKMEGMHIWDSENDSRLFNEHNNEYEPILPFLINQYNKHITKLSTLKINQ